MKDNFIPYLKARLRERSTWLGLISLVSAIGVSISPEATESIITLGIALAGGTLVVTQDTPPSAGN